MQVSRRICVRGSFSVAEVTTLARNGWMLIKDGAYSDFQCSIATSPGRSIDMMATVVWGDGSRLYFLLGENTGGGFDDLADVAFADVASISAFIADLLEKRSQHKPANLQRLLFLADMYNSEMMELVKMATLFVGFVCRDLDMFEEKL